MVESIAYPTETTWKNMWWLNGILVRLHFDVYDGWHHVNRTKFWSPSGLPSPSGPPLVVFGYDHQYYVLQLSRISWISRHWLGLDLHQGQRNFWDLISHYAYVGISNCDLIHPPSSLLHPSTNAQGCSRNSWPGLGYIIVKKLVVWNSVCLLYPVVWSWVRLMAA